MRAGVVAVPTLLRRAVQSTTPPRAAVYLRMSTDTQEYSIERQRSQAVPSAAPRFKRRMQEVLRCNFQPAEVAPTDDGEGDVHADA
jgi:hypothetical protein